MEDIIIKEIDTPIDENNDKSVDLSNETPVNVRAVSSLIRLIGTLIIVSGTLIFMFKNWQGYSHPQMYLTFIASTIFMAIAGLFLGLTIKDSKSARVLLMIVTALAPMHFAQLGGFIISFIGKFKPKIPYPNAFVWQTDSLQTVVLLSIGTFIIILPILYLAFSTLFRSKAEFITALYLLLNMILLIPLRAAGWVALFVAIMLGMLIYSLLTQLCAESANKTLEGKVVLCLLFLPLVILIVRAYYVDIFSIFFTGVLCEIVAVALFVFANRRDKEDSAAPALHFLATICTVVGCWFIESDMVNGRYSDYYSIIYLLPTSFITAISGIFAPKNKGKYFSTACSVAVLSTFFQICFGEDNTEIIRISGLLTSILSIYYVCSANVKKYHTLLFFSICQFIVIFVMELDDAIKESNIWHWVTLSVTGVFVIVLASFIEKTLTK